MMDVIGRVTKNLPWLYLASIDIDSGFSPDPYLTGVAAELTITGTQDSGVQACIKRMLSIPSNCRSCRNPDMKTPDFIGYEQETQRFPTTTDNGTVIFAISSNIDDRTIHELYLWPFANAVRSGVSSVMCSYNRVNSTYSCENSKTLNGLLKEELFFQGYVVSDWGGTHSGVPAILAGEDQDMPGKNHLVFCLFARPFPCTDVA